MNKKLLINGELTEGTGPAEKIINPRNEELILDLCEASSEQVEAAVAGAREAFGQWSQTTPGDRSAALLEIASRIESEGEAFGKLEALNCGKPINAAIGDEIPAIDYNQNETETWNYCYTRLKAMLKTNACDETNQTISDMENNIEGFSSTTIP